MVIGPWSRRDDWGGGGRGPFEVDSFHALPIGIILNAEKCAWDRSPRPPPPGAAAHELQGQGATAKGKGTSPKVRGPVKLRSHLE